jgi:pimeloyl-ACP methyl ester carboxylesterase
MAQSTPLGILKLVLLGCLAAYFGLALFALLFARSMVFPAPAPNYPPSVDWPRFVYGEGPDDYVITRYLPNPEARFLVLYQHGNAEDLGVIDGRMEILRQLGYAVLAWEYPGYGHSPGKTSEKAILEVAGQLLERTPQATGFPIERILLYGRSVGSGPSTWMATQKPVAGLILEGPFTSTFRVVTQVKVLPWDIFDNLARIPNIQCPVLILHGTRDETVPFSHGKKLLEAAPEPRSFAWFTDGGHNNLIEDYTDVYSSAILQFTGSLN